MNKRIFAFFLFLFSCVYSYSNITDSLLSSLDTIEVDTHRVSEFNRLARQTLFSDKELGHAISDSNMREALATKKELLIGRAKHEKAILHLIFLEYNEAKPYLRQAISHLKKANDENYLGYVYRNFGVAQAYTNFYDSSITAYFNALQILDTNKERDLLYYGLTCEELSKVFYQNSSLQSSRKYALIAQGIFRDLNDTLKTMDLYNLLALSEENPDTSLIYLQKLLDYSVEKGDSARIYNTYANIGYTLIEKEEFEKSKPFCIKAYKWFLKHNINFKAKVAVNLTNIYLQEGKLDSAEFFIKIGLESALEADDQYTLENAYSNYALLAEKQNDYKTSYEMLKKSKDLAIENRNYKNEQKVRSSELELDLLNNKKELEFIKKEQELLSKTSQQKGIFLIFSLFGVGILLALSILLWRTQKKLKADKISLEQSLANNKNLFAIIGHDLRAPLANISSAFEIIPSQKDRLTNETLEIFSLIKQSLNQVTELLENLLIWSKTTRNDYNFELTAFTIKTEIEKVINLSKLSIHNKKLKVKTDGNEELKIKADAHAFHTIIRNLISNSIKASKENSEVSFTWHKKNEWVELSVEDEAGGLPKKQAELIQGLKNNDEFDKQELSNISGGLGLKLIIYLMLACKGTLNYEPTAKGSRFTLAFKNF